MLARRCATLPAALSAGPWAIHSPSTLQTQVRFKSRLTLTSLDLSNNLSASSSDASRPVTITTTMSTPSQSVAQQWQSVQSAAAASPSYLASVLQSRYTHTSSSEGMNKESVTPFSAGLALLRRFSYVHHLSERLGLLKTAPSTVTLSTAERASLDSLFSALRQRRGIATVTPSPDGKRLSKDNSNSSGSNSNKGDDQSKDDSAGNGGEDDEEKPEDWIVPRTCLFVLMMIALTVLLYQMARPSGRHTGWSSLNQHAGEIREVVLYDNYIQIYLDQAKVYLGLVNDHDTQYHMDELAGLYHTARQKAIGEEQQKPQQLKSQDTTEETRSSAMDSVNALTSAFAGKKLSAVDKPEELEVTMKGRPLAETALIGVGVFAWVVPFIFFPVFVMFLSQYIGKSMSYAVEATKGKSKVKEMIFRVESSSSTRFRDVAGMKEPKKEITEIVDFLRHPERYTRLGAKIPTGAMLLGPPGTGKTLLAKAVAGESGVGFIPSIGSDFVELYVGMGALRVRQLFKEARKQRCIIYIDEIDAIGLKRQGAGHGEKQEQEQTLNELLTQLDGFSTGKRGEVMVLASSNVPQEALDPALIRPGRFDRIIHVDTPVISERVDIFKVHLSKLKLVADEVKGVDGVKESEMEKIASTAEATAGKEKEEPVAAEPISAEKEEAPPTPDATAANQSGSTSLVISQVEAEKLAFEKSSKDGAPDDASASTTATNTEHDFDFRSLLMTKSDAERAMIDVYAERMSNLCPGFVGADIANVCNEGAILAAREGADHVDISHLERSIDRVLAGIEHRSRAMSEFEKNVVAHHEAGHAVAGWFLNRADPLMKVSIVPRGGSALGYAQYLPNENYTRTAKEIRDSISVTLGGRVAEQIFFQHLSTGASDDLRKVGRMAYQYVSSFSPGSVYPAPGTNSTRLVKPFGLSRSNELDRRAKTLVDDVFADTVKLLTEHKEDMEKLAAHLLKHELLTYADVVHYLGARGTRQADKKKGV